MLLLRLPAALVHAVNTDMHPLPLTGADAQDAHAQSPVAGRIEARPGELLTALDDWTAYLRARRRKPDTVANYRSIVMRAINETGWHMASDLTFEAITGWLAKRQYSGSSYNCALSTWRGFCEYLVASEIIARNPLRMADRAANDSAGGSRAATTEEARAMITYARMRDLTDRRAKGARALYWLCLFQIGCRIGEPAKWQRRHLILDEAVPYIAWEPAINKNGQAQRIAIAAEVAQSLREHLAAEDRERAAAGLTPAGPRSLVFPHKPTKNTFRNDRAAAGIASKDRHGAAITAHSARKWFATELTRLGMAEKMVDHLMRHAGRPEHRYFRPTLEEQSQALAIMPALWPLQGQKGGARKIRDKSAGENLTVGPQQAEDEPATLRVSKTTRLIQARSRSGQSRRVVFLAPATRAGLNEPLPGAASIEASEPGDDQAPAHRGLKWAQQDSNL